MGDRCRRRWGKVLKQRAREQCPSEWDLGAGTLDPAKARRQDGRHQRCRVVVWSVVVIKDKAGWVTWRLPVGAGWGPKEAGQNTKRDRIKDRLGQQWLIRQEVWKEHKEQSGKYCSMQVHGSLLRSKRQSCGKCLLFLLCVGWAEQMFQPTNFRQKPEEQRTYIERRLTAL